MIIEAWSKIAAIFMYKVRGEIMSPAIHIARFMLPESFLGCFTGHPNIKALQNTIKLRVSFTESAVFGEYPFG